MFEEMPFEEHKSNDRWLSAVFGVLSSVGPIITPYFFSQGLWVNDVSYTEVIERSVNFCIHRVHDERSYV